MPYGRLGGRPLGRTVEAMFQLCGVTCWWIIGLTAYWFHNLPHRDCVAYDRQAFAAWYSSQSCRTILMSDSICSSTRRHRLTTRQKLTEGSRIHRCNPNRRQADRRTLDHGPAKGVPDFERIAFAHATPPARPFASLIGFCLDSMGRMFLICFPVVKEYWLHPAGPDSNQLQPHSKSAVISDHLLAQNDASWMQSISETRPKRACGWQRNSRGIIRDAFS